MLRCLMVFIYYHKCTISLIYGKGLLHIPYRMYIYIYMKIYALVYRKGMSQGKRLQIEMGNSIFAMIASAHDLAASQSCIEMDSTVSLTECM